MRRSLETALAGRLDFCRGLLVRMTASRRPYLHRSDARRGGGGPAGIDEAQLLVSNLSAMR